MTNIPICKAVGIPCAPADAVDDVKQAASIVTDRGGGQGI